MFSSEFALRSWTNNLKIMFLFVFFCQFVCFYCYFLFYLTFVWLWTKCLPMIVMTELYLFHWIHDTSDSIQTVLCGSLVGFGPHIGWVFAALFASIKCFLFLVMILCYSCKMNLNFTSDFHSHPAVWICFDRVF